MTGSAQLARRGSDRPARRCSVCSLVSSRAGWNVLAVQRWRAAEPVRGGLCVAFIAATVGVSARYVRGEYAADTRRAVRPRVEDAALIRRGIRRGQVGAL